MPCFSKPLLFGQSANAIAKDQSVTSDQASTVEVDVQLCQLGVTRAVLSVVWVLNVLLVASIHDYHNWDHDSMLEINMARFVHLICCLFASQSWPAGLRFPWWMTNPPLASCYSFTWETFSWATNRMWRKTKKRILVEAVQFIVSRCTQDIDVSRYKLYRMKDLRRKIFLSLRLATSIVCRNYCLHILSFFSKKNSRYFIRTYVNHSATLCLEFAEEQVVLAMCCFGHRARV